MVSFTMKHGAAVAVLLATTAVSGIAVAQTNLSNTVIQSTGTGAITTPGDINTRIVVPGQQIDRVVVQPVATDQRIVVRPVPTGEVVTGGFADIAECYEEGESPASDRDRLPACPAELADLGEIQYVNEPVQQPMVVEQPVVQVAEPVQLDLATVTRGTPCGPGTGTACANTAANLQNVRPYFGTTPPPPPQPVAYTPPPPPQPVAYTPPPAPQPVVYTPPPPVAVTPIPAAGFGGIGAAGLITAGIGALAIGGIIYAIADDDDDNNSSNGTRDND